MEIIYWRRVGEEVKTIKARKGVVKYRIAPFVQWKVLVADEDAEVKKGLPIVVKIKDLEIPENTIIAPLSIMRHYLGVTIDVIEEGLKKVEEEKKITHAVFLPVEDGKICKNDIIGVIKIFFVKTGLIERQLGFSASDIKIREEIFGANLVYKEGEEIKREEIKNKIFGYFKSYIADWEPLIAAERVEVKKGEIARLKLKPVSLPPNTVVTPLHIMRNALGSVVEVVQKGKPSRVEEMKTIEEAIFLPVKSGKIEKGDLLGVLNIYYVAINKVAEHFEMRSKEEKLAKIVFEEDGKISRKEIRIMPFAYRRKPISRWEPIVAAEDVDLRRGEAVEIKIEPIKLEENTIVYPLYIMKNAYGTVVDLVEKELRKVEEEKTLCKVIFMPIFDGKIRKGQMVGVVNIYSVEVRPHRMMEEWFKEWVGGLKDVMR